MADGALPAEDDGAPRISRRQLAQGALIAAPVLALLRAEPSSAAEKVNGSTPQSAGVRAATAAALRDSHRGSLLDTFASTDEHRLRYVFTHMTEFTGHARIAVGPKAAPAPARAPADQAARLRLRGEDGAGRPLADFVSDPASGVDALIALSRGRIVFEDYPRVAPGDRHIMWSVTKVLVGTLVAMPVDRGQIDPSRTVERYVPALKGSGWDGVSVRDVLDMASGIDAREHVPDALTDPRVPYYRYEASLGTAPLAGLPPLSTFEVTAGYKRRVAPGTLYEYTSVDTFVLAWLVEEVGGVPLAEALSRDIWMPMGAETEAALLISPRGAPGADGGLSCTLRDIALFGHQFTRLARRGAVARRIVSDRYLAAIAAGRPEVYRAGIATLPNLPRIGSPTDLPRCNSWQWDATWTDGDMFKSGWSGQGLYVSPSRDFVLAYSGTPVGGHDNRLHRYVRDIANDFHERR